ncbi:hypothetical protein RTM1035_16682 [Roseovarius sp. TM1035]|nr:hypothetical protein RTM1035_16682 [Roseovarius sp. TM1035]
MEEFLLQCFSISSDVGLTKAF